MLPLIGGVVIALGALVAAGIGIRKLIYHTQGLTEEVKALNEATKAANALNKENADIMNELALARKGFSDSISTQTQLSIASGNAIQENNLLIQLGACILFPTLLFLDRNKDQ